MTMCVCNNVKVYKKLAKTQAGRFDVSEMASIGILRREQESLVVIALACGVVWR